jgi:hypothetical protein
MRLTLFVLLASLLPAAPPQSTEVAPPPPPRKVPTPPKQERIRVSGAVQATPGPPLGGEWLGMNMVVSHEGLEALDRAVMRNPESLCARGWLIASIPYPSDREIQAIRLTRVEHLLGMIQFHPEWDGFSLDPFAGMAEPRSPHERDSDSHQRLRDAWSRQIGPAQQSAMALHNAAMFFAIREPELAASLLRRAIAMEPTEELYIERLGLVYGVAQVRAERLDKFGVVSSPERIAFARQARELLLSSNDWILVRGGSAGLARCGCGQDQLHKELLERADALSEKRQLPSSSDRFRRGDCPLVASIDK